MITLAELVPMAQETPTHEYVLLGVGALFTLALLVGFIVLMVMQRGKK